MDRKTLVGTALMLSVVACDDVLGPSIDAPTNLVYEVEASGDPTAPAGLLLVWDAITDPALEVYRVYSRADNQSDFDLRSSTTSTTFHDVGQPDLEYYVTAVADDGEESDRSNVVLIDERLRLEAPTSLSSITLNGAIHLHWSDNAFTTGGNAFKQYRVYSTSYSLDQDVCGVTWVREGTTVSPEFLVASLENGISWCYAVSAESIEGFESLWSPSRADTPRPDARNLLMYPYQVDPTRSGFRFFEDVNNDGQAGALELGVIADGDRLDIDFTLDRITGDTIVMLPIRGGTGVVDVGLVDDLTDIDFAPAMGFETTGITAEPGVGYVFEMDGGDGFVRYGALRMTHVGREFVIFDWSYQTDPGNPELSIHGGLPTSTGRGSHRRAEVMGPRQQELPPPPFPDGPPWP